jgi:bifunctional pyridoxal-dependent enzyme with beta-cystathionase and maltose regulon repressor activities
VKQIVLTELDVQFIEMVLDAMHKIIDPGQYGLGTEPGSYADNDKAAWEKLGGYHSMLCTIINHKKEKAQ